MFFIGFLAGFLSPIIYQAVEQITHSFYAFLIMEMVMILPHVVTGRIKWIKRGTVLRTDIKEALLWGRCYYFYGKFHNFSLFIFNF